MGSFFILACIDLLSVLQTAYNKKNYAVCLFFIIKKAFDNINHSRLLKKWSDMA